MANETYRIDIPLKVSDHTEPGISKGIKNLSRFDEANKKTQKQLDKMNEDTYKLPIEVVDRVSGPLETILSLIGDYNGELRSLAESGSKITIPIVNIDKSVLNNSRSSFGEPNMLNKLSHNNTKENESASTGNSEQASIQSFAADLRDARDNFIKFKGGIDIAAYFEKLGELNTLSKNSKSTLEQAVVGLKNSQNVLEDAKKIKIAKKGNYRDLLKGKNVADDVKSKSLSEFRESNKNYRAARKSKNANYSNLKEAKQNYKAANQAIDEMKESMKPSGRLAKTSIPQKTYKWLGNMGEKVIGFGKNMVGKGIEKAPRISSWGKKALNTGGDMLANAKSGLGKMPIISELGSKIKGFKNIKGLPLIGNLIGLGASAATIAAASPEERGRETAGEIGSWVGSALGTFIGGGLGSAVPGAGTVIGGVAGGMAGAKWGEQAGEWLYDKGDFIASVGNNVKDSIFGFFSGNKNKSNDASNIEKQTQSELAIQPHMNYATGSNSGKVGVVGASSIIGGLLGGPIGSLLGGTIGGLGKTFGGEKLTDWIKDKTDSITTFGNTLKALIPNPSMTNEVQPVPTSEFSDELVPVKALRNTPQNDIKINLELKTEPKITIENHSELNNESNIISLLRSYIREMTDDIGDELANKLTHVFSNMPEMEVE